MKTRHRNTIFFGISGIAIFLAVIFLFYDTINPLDLALPRTEYGTIDYVKIGHDASKRDFEFKLALSNIQYDPNDFILLTGGIQESYPPRSSYCGYVISDNMEDYWYSSSHHKNTITNSQIHDENPYPCQPNRNSCHCMIEKKLSEQSISELSYFTEDQENLVGKLVLERILQNPNLNSDFKVGKFNFEYKDYDDVTSFCGVFTEQKQNRYFGGDIRNNTIIDFHLENELPKLCSISDNAKIFEYEN